MYTNVKKKGKKKVSDTCWPTMIVMINVPKQVERFEMGSPAHSSSSSFIHSSKKNESILIQQMGRMGLRFHTAAYKVQSMHF